MEDMGGLTAIHLSLIFLVVSNVCHSACVWPTALKLGCVTNFDMCFLVMGFVCLVNEIQFISLISSRHFCMKSYGHEQHPEEKLRDVCISFNPPVSQLLF